MEKQLLVFNEKEFKKEMMILSLKASSLSTVISQFNELKIGAMELSELQYALSKPRDFVYDKLMKQKPQLLPGLDIDKSEALKLFKIKGLEAFIKAVDDAKSRLQEKGIEFNPDQDNLSKYYELNKIGKVVLQQPVVDNIRSNYEERAESETAIEICLVANNLIEDLNKSGILDKVLFVSKSGFGPRLKEFMSQLLLVNEQTREVKVNPLLVKTYN